MTNKNESYVMFPVCPSSKKLLIKYLMVMPDKESAEKTKEFMKNTGMATVLLPASQVSSYEEYVEHYKKTMSEDMVESIKSPRV